MAELLDRTVDAGHLRLQSCPRWRVALIGISTGRRYPCPLTVFDDFDEGEQYVNEANGIFPMQGKSRWMLERTSDA